MINQTKSKQIHKPFAKRLAYETLPLAFYAAQRLPSSSLCKSWSERYQIQWESIPIPNTEEYHVLQQFCMSSWLPTPNYNNTHQQYFFIIEHVHIYQVNIITTRLHKTIYEKGNFWVINITKLHRIPALISAFLCLPAFFLPSPDLKPLPFPPTSASFPASDRFPFADAPNDASERAAHVLRAAWNTAIKRHKRNHLQSYILIWPQISWYCAFSRY